MQATPRSRATAGRGPASRSAAPTTASVRLARELAHHRAPAALVAHARDAALGERRQRARHAPPRCEVRGRRRRLQAAHAPSSRAASGRRPRRERGRGLCPRDVRRAHGARAGAPRSTTYTRRESVTCHRTSNPGSTRRAAAPCAVSSTRPSAVRARSTRGSSGWWGAPEARSLAAYLEASRWAEAAPSLG